MPFVTIRYPRGDGAAMARAFDMAQALRRAGAMVGEPQPASISERRPRVAFFFAEDAVRAARLAQHVGGTASEMRLSAAGPGTMPWPGALIITLPRTISAARAGAR